MRDNLERVRERIGPDVEILAATKYVDAGDLPALAEAGIELVGENRAQDLLAKQERHRDLFTWDFIGALQSRKLKEIAPNVRLIHSIASESALRRLEQHPAQVEHAPLDGAGYVGEALGHLGADLVAAAADARADRGDGRRVEPRDRLGDDAAGERAPAAMQHGGPPPVGERDRVAVGDQHEQTQARDGAQVPVDPRQLLVSRLRVGGLGIGPVPFAQV